MADHSPDHEVDDPIDLAGAFPAATAQQWEQLVVKALKRDSVDDALALVRTTTYDDITIEPIYTASDAVDDRALGLPGSGPLTRGRTATATRDRGWDIRQRVAATAGPHAALSELERGATSLWIGLDATGTAEADLRAVLDGVLLDVAPVVLDAGAGWSLAAAALHAQWDRTGVKPAAGGSLGADPFGAWASDRSSDRTSGLADVATWATRLADDAPGVYTATVDGTRYHDAGASDGQELGFTIAAAVATVRELGTVADPFAATELRFAATADQFATIAKLRAARTVWARVAELAGAQGAAAASRLHAVTSRAMTTRYDQAVNMLRATVACFAAGVAGADAITTLAFDAPSDTGAASDLGRRLARNTQSVLALEAHLADVIDPAGGSWYVERLTAQMADAAWAIVQQVDAAGGFVAAVESGLLADSIAAVRARRDADVDTRRAPITGLSEFPNVDEPPAVAEAAPATASEGLPVHRWGERFEAIRARVDAATQATGARPLVYLATLGTPSDFTARTTFAKNLFEVAGVVTVPGAVDGFAASGATVACVCSSEAVYDTNAGADSAVAALHAAGAKHVYLAGRDGVVVAGSDARQALADLLDHLELP